jgi:hypothetical protein
MVRTITQKTKRKAKERPKDVQLAKPKEGRELVPLVVGNYFTHNPFNVTSMQIVKFDSSRRSRTSISHQCNLPFYNRS